MCTKNDQLKTALQKAREHYGVKKYEPYYNEAGFVARPAPQSMGEAVWPKHQPYDLPVEREDWRDNPPE